MPNAATQLNKTDSGSIKDIWTISLAGISEDDYN
jgi:hypothetical protein